MELIAKRANDVRAFLRACGAAGWLEYRNLRFRPINLALAAVQQLTTVGVWYFTATFLSAGANSAVSADGGHYVGYVLIGVLVNQIGLAALGGPFTTISEAFWDKRLETYRLAVHGIWANIVGRLGWQVLFAVVLQCAALVVLLAIGAIHIAPGANLLLIGITCLLFVGANAGLGIAGASLFFLLEVKAGQDPITWAYRYLVMLASGLYIPVALLPGWLRGLGAVLPQTFGFAALRALALTGADWRAPQVFGNLAGLTLATVITLAVGIGLFMLALAQAERRGGIGVVV
jgi:ABC-2 type transport system permease protein